jgi:hypothetical protein
MVQLGIRAGRVGAHQSALMTNVKYIAQACSTIVITIAK